MPGIQRFLNRGSLFKYTIKLICNERPVSLAYIHLFSSVQVVTVETENNEVGKLTGI